MIQYSFRFIKRFAILIPGLIIAYLSVFKIFPYFEDQLPLTIAIFVTYILAAYILIPAIIRVLRSIFPAKHLPLYCVTPDGFASDPLNVGIESTQQELIAIMEAADWHVADKIGVLSSFKQITSTLLSQPYATAPVSYLYLFGRRQDIAFEKSINGKRGGRHHVRFWATTYQQDSPLNRDTIHWSKRQPPDVSKKVLWVGAASLDGGVTLIRHNFQISHMIHPDTNNEREFIVTELRALKIVQKITQVKLGKAYKLTNRVWRGYLLSDGIMTVLQLR